MSKRHQSLGGLPGIDPARKAWRAERALLQTWVSPDLKARIDAQAKADGLSVAAFLRRILSRKFPA